MSEIISLLSDSEEEFQTSETPTNFRKVKKEPEEEEPLECPRGLQATDTPKNLQAVKKEPKEEEEPEEVKDDEPSASLQLQNTRQERQELQKKLQELARRESLLEMQVEFENNLERAREKRAAKPNARRKNQPVNATLRQLIYERMEDGFAAKDVAELYNVSQGTVYNIHKQGAEPPHKKRRRSGPKSIYDNYEVIVFLLDLIEKEPELTLEQTVERLDNKGYQTSETALCRFYKGAKLTWKKIYPIPNNWNEKRIIEARKQFVEGFLLKSLNKDCVYLDECGFHLSQLRRSKAGSLSGKKAILSVQPRSKRLNIIAALSKSKGIIGTKTVISTISRRENAEGKGGANEDFRAFLMDLAPKVRGCLLITDNCKTHHATIMLEETWKVLEEHNITYMFLPPYSPFLNPIEYVFNKVKEKLQKEKFDGHREFKEKLLEEFHHGITTEEALNYYNRSATFFEACMKGLPFKGPILNPTV